MKELSIHEIRRIELDILLKFDSFCKENDIQYYLSNGTLLGAVKYKGFIPWDDDIDVFVPRKDYDKLIEKYIDDERYRLIAHERYPDYLYPFSKLCDMSTLKQEANINNGVTLGIDIDIFPLDIWDSDLKCAKKEAKQIQHYMFCLGLAKLNEADSINSIKRAVKTICMIICKLWGPTRFIKKIIACATNNRVKSTYVGCKVWPIYGYREIIPAEVFSDTIEVEFEGMSFPAPVGYDIYLRSLYGDYKKDPPLERQKTHHLFEAYNL